MLKPRCAAALRFSPRGSARFPPGTCQLPCLRAQGDRPEREAAAGAVRLYAPVGA